MAKVSIPEWGWVAVSLSQFDSEASTQGGVESVVYSTMLVVMVSYLSIYLMQKTLEASTFLTQKAQKMTCSRGACKPEK